MKPARTSTRTRSARPVVRLLFTCIGRRVELVRAFRQAAGKLKIRLLIHGADSSSLSPALSHVDRAHLVPPLTSRGYVKRMLELVQRYRIDLVVPLIDHELAIMAATVERFAELGCRAIVSSPKVVQTCQDKIATHQALKRAGIATPMTWRWPEAVRRKRLRFPLFLKPRSGSAAMGNYIVHNRDELRVFGKRVDDAIVQEFIDGVEHTLDVYTGFDGHPRCVVPRQRIEVRSGEVSKGVTVKDAAIMEVGRRVATALDGCRGVVTVQCIVPPKGVIRVIEINPRFGGGVPLSIHAGADFCKWILMEHLGRKPRIKQAAFRDDVAMLRFDDSVFLSNKTKR